MGPTLVISDACMQTIQSGACQTGARTFNALQSRHTLRLYTSRCIEQGTSSQVWELDQEEKQNEWPEVAAGLWLPIYKVACMRSRLLHHHLHALTAAGVQNRLLVGQLEALAAKKGCTSSQLAIAWLLHKSPNVIPLFGSKSP